ncbi:MAG: glycoside hydrolase family 16 protein, partial [Clostridia bacterium]|nr:glycoside hydrolase family 16 protein [Clostridia bacterium]
QIGYSPVFKDEFEGDSLDWTVWSAIDDVNRCGYSCKEQAKVYDGQLHLMGNYVTDGEHGEGWYGCDLKLNQWYAYGYFKSVIRTSVCKERSQDFWSAFWIQGPSPYDPDLSQGGVGEGGAELDIMENFGYDYTSCCFWMAGYEGTAGLDGSLYGALHEVHNLGIDYSEDFHTYALLWDESYYRVYVDDILIACTHFGYGTSHVPEEVRLSLEVPKGFNVPEDTFREMTVESIEIWQKP